MTQSTPRRIAGLLAAGLLTATLAACSGSTTTSSNAPVVAAAAPAASSQSSADPSASGASAGAIILALTDGSQASYRAREQLVGNSLPSDAVGTTHGVTGTVVVNPDGTVASDQSQITVDLASLTSDQGRRDNFIKGNTLETNQFPTATFVPTAIQGLPTPLPTSGEATFQLLGNLTVHGVTQPVTWDVTAQFGDSSVSGNATTTVQITDFGMTPPKAGPVLSIENTVTLDLAFTAARQA
jgi:polyisoprenoid-binding protein YceI